MTGLSSAQIWCSSVYTQLYCHIGGLWTRCSAIAERPRRRAAVRVHLFWPKVEDWNWETTFYGHYRSIFNNCDIIGLQIKLSNSAKKRKIRAITPFKVIQDNREVGTNRKPVCDFLLVIKSNWQPISYRFGAIAAYCLSLIHIWRCRRSTLCRSRWSPYH